MVFLIHFMYLYCSIKNRWLFQEGGVVNENVAITYIFYFILWSMSFTRFSQNWPQWIFTEVYSVQCPTKCIRTHFHVHHLVLLLILLHHSIVQVGQCLLCITLWINLLSCAQLNKMAEKKKHHSIRFSKFRFKILEIALVSMVATSVSYENKDR